MTSNLGSHLIAELSREADVGDVEEKVMEIVRAHFRPEFLNRLDEITLFTRLTREHLAGIVEIQIGRLQKLLEDQKIGLDLSPAAKAALGDMGYDPVYGARPLKRVIQRELQDPLADMILAGKIKDGAVIQVDADKKGITLTPAGKARKTS